LKPQHDAHRVQQHEDPADLRVLQHRHVDHQCGRHPEVDRVGERVDLGAHPGLGVQRAGNAAVDAVEDGGSADQGQRDPRLLVERELDRGHARADGQHRGRARQDAQAALAGVAVHASAANGVSPPMAR
jgi:hypothetical protein